MKYYSHTIFVLINLRMIEASLSSVHKGTTSLFYELCCAMSYDNIIVLVHNTEHTKVEKAWCFNLSRARIRDSSVCKKTTAAIDS